MRPKDQALASRLSLELDSFDQQVIALPGISTQANKDCFLEQLAESVHRIEFTKVISGQQAVNGRFKQISRVCLNPNSNAFDPLKAAVLENNRGNHDNACWLVFLSTHFGKNLRTGWELTRNYYGQLGNGNLWDWNSISANPQAARQWLQQNQQQLKQTGNFGNHRKYQSIDANKPAGTGAAIDSYITWITTAGSHSQLVRDIHTQEGQNPRAVFAEMYKQLNAVTSFGRTAKFDYLTMLGKLGLAPIEPGSTFMTGATGPLSGARLLFGRPHGKAKDLDTLLVQLEARLNLPFGMQVLEDALCNWQKSPAQFIAFRG